MPPRGITLRDLVNAIPLYAIKAGLLTVEKKGKKNVFSGRILEIEGLPDLKVEQAFELSDAAAERSAAACSVQLNKAPIVEYMRSNITLMKWMIAEGYEDARTLKRRIKAMEDWIANGVLLQPDANAEYAAVIEIDLADVTEPILACPNDPDDVKVLSEVGRQDRRSVHRLLHDQHRPLPRRGQGAGRQVRHPDPPVDRPADQDGRPHPDRRRLLQRPRQGRRP
jgi:aconitase B